MTTKEKAKEICGCDVHGCDFNCEKCCIEFEVDDLMEMAEWKEEQMIEKAQEFIATYFYNHPHAESMVCSDEFKNVDELVERLKQAMKG